MSCSLDSAASRGSQLRLQRGELGRELRHLSLRLLPLSC
jgi:hypothetical protein